MGDRALIIFTDGKETSPVIYLHWLGNQVPELLEQHKALMADRLNDLNYAAARFIGVCHMRDSDSNLSLGTWNIEAQLHNAIISGNDKVIADASHGDAGVIVVNVKDFSWKAYGGYLSKTKAA